MELAFLFSCTSQGHNALPRPGLEPGLSDSEPSALDYWTKLWCWRAILYNYGATLCELRYKWVSINIPQYVKLGTNPLKILKIVLWPTLWASGEKCLPLSNSHTCNLAFMKTLTLSFPGSHIISPYLIGASPFSLSTIQFLLC